MSSRANKESREEAQERKKRSMRPPATAPSGRLRSRGEMIDAVLEEAETGRPKKKR